MSPVIYRQYPVARELSNNWIPRAKNLQIAFWIFPCARLAVVLGNRGSLRSMTVTETLRALLRFGLSLRKPNPEFDLLCLNDKHRENTIIFDILL